MAAGDSGKSIEADWFCDNRASLHNAGEALRSYLFAVSVLTEGIAQKGIALPDAKRRLFVRAVHGFHQCLGRMADQSFLKGDAAFKEVLRELGTLIEGTERKLGLNEREAAAKPAEPEPPRAEPPAALVAPVATPGYAADPNAASEPVEPAEPVSPRMKTGRLSPVYITVGSMKKKIYYDERPR